jgi:hypothetical protein
MGLEIPNTLSDTEIAELAYLGKRLILSLKCDINETGCPCHTDRMTAVKDMRRYLEIHEYSISEGVSS